MALLDAQAAVALLQATPADPANASRRWALALAEGERALALRHLGRAAAAEQAAQAAAALWAPGVPGSYGAWQHRSS